MLEEKAGLLAGKVWEILNAHGALTEKEILKEMKTRKSTDFYLAIGWLLREGKLNCYGEKELKFELK
ncbi:MAG: winged helix-turn-helix domain-containing protein [Bacteroidaceae bacterium]|nr:winged helix-turn-helix domain-containing protein [Bacteroidaceae bacterium]